MSSPADRCPGCGMLSPAGGHPAPPEFSASPGCWRRYGELLARSFGTSEYRSVHQLVVDSYVAQHPTNATRRSVQQVALCLMTLDLFLEQGWDVARGPDLHERMVTNLPELRALDPPNTTTNLTVEHVLGANDIAAYHHLVQAWAQQVWNAWQAHHRTIRRWNDEALRLG
jgi:hypothetical protein